MMLDGFGEDGDTINEDLTLFENSEERAYKDERQIKSNYSLWANTLKHNLHKTEAVLKWQ